MGYYLSTLKNLPKHFECYFFLIGDYQIHSPINNFFNDDFNEIANCLGSDAAIISQTKNSKIEKELESAIHKHQFAGTKISFLLDHLAGRYPGLLISQSHPKLWTDSEEFYYVPFEVLDEIYHTSPNVLLRDLVNFKKNENGLRGKVKKWERERQRLGLSISLAIGPISISKEI